MSDDPVPPQGPEEPKPEPVQPTPAPPPADATPSPEPPPPGPAPVSYGAPSTPLSPEAADIEKNKVFAALSYVGLLWLVPLLAAKDSPYAKYHCNQGILLSFILVLYFFLAMMEIIPYVNCLMCFMWPVLLGLHLTLVILGLVNALNGKMKPLPLFPVVTWVK